MFSLNYMDYDHHEKPPYLELDEADPSIWTRCATSPGARWSFETGLCGSCVSLITTVSEGDYLRSPGQDSWAVEMAVAHLDGKTASLYSSANTCSLCSLICEELHKHPTHECYETTVNSGGAEGVFYVEAGRASADYVSVPIGLYERSKQPNPRRDERIIFREYKDRKGGGLVPVSESYPSSPPQLQLVAGWMATCQEHHETCALTRVHLELPKRVLDISSSDYSISLYESQPGERVPYATLSYCWGEGVPLRTTTGNISHHRQGIPLSELPRTLKESVVFARGLGFRYLWIDALCIIQDSDADWAEQAAAMASIYQGCSLNIAIADAPSCDAGSTSNFADKCRRIASSSVLGEAMDMVAAAEFVQAREGETTLTRRGWVLQETLVSVASVYVTARGLLWDCCSAGWDENGDSSLGQTHYLNSAKAEWASCEVNGGSGVREALSRRGAADAYSASMRAWHGWMSSFSTRALTNSSDKLPAVAGIASHFAASGSTYAAGLWREDLHVGLAWSAKKAGTLVRHHDRAPSWSWASVDGAFEYPRWMSVSKYEAIVYTSDPTDLEIVEVSVEERQPGTFGSVYGGRIEAIAILDPGTVCGDSENPQFHFDSERPLSSEYKYTLDEPGHFGDQPRPCWL
ncbi:HET domain-containing protein, partial [Candidatus Bathyarchaeota archaeon]|nr:HET domain-containing protein [Candidatus Bathyarchaeota archaeon]